MVAALPGSTLAAAVYDGLTTWLNLRLHGDAAPPPWDVNHAGAGSSHYVKPQKTIRAIDRGFTAQPHDPRSVRLSSTYNSAIPDS